MDPNRYPNRPTAPAAPSDSPLPPAESGASAAVDPSTSVAGDGGATAAALPPPSGGSDSFPSFARAAGGAGDGAAGGGVAGVAGASAGQTVDGAIGAVGGGAAGEAALGRRAGSRWRRWTAAGAAALVLVGGGGLAGGFAVHALDPRAAGGTASASTSVATAAASKSLTAVIAAVKDQVVSITVKGSSGEVEGSGVIVRSDGVIVTNNHVVSGAGTGATLTVTLASGKTVDATVLATDPSADLALIKASGVSGLSAATLGESDSVQVGDSVVAIGNEYGLAGSASAGIVSALHRTITVGTAQSSPNGQQSVSDSTGTTYPDAIQTDAAINEGDSGGALFNMSGQVIGINAAIATTGSGSGSVGIGFAIPIDTVKQFIDKTL